MPSKYRIFRILTLALAAVLYILFVIFPCLSFYPAFSPIGMVLHVDGVLPIFLSLAAIYGLLFAAHRLGKYRLKER